jgi:hypothetical protein
VVRQVAVGIGHTGPAVDHQDLRVLIQATQPRRARGASHDATDDDDDADADDFHGADDRWFTDAGSLAPSKPTAQRQAEVRWPVLPHFPLGCACSAGRCVADDADKFLGSFGHVGHEGSPRAA